MSPQLPNEILGLVMDSLALKSRKDCIQDLLCCCLASRALRTLCKKHIFHTVSLWTPSSTSDIRLTSANGLPRLKRTAALVRAILDNPSLGLYVRRLDYKVAHFPRNEDEGLDEVLDTIGLMPNIVDFSLGLCIEATSSEERRTESTFRQTAGKAHNSRWRAAMLDVIRRPGMKTLRFSNINGFHITEVPMSIEALHLSNTAFDYTHIESVQVPRGRIQLKGLVCDQSSMLSIDGYLEAAAAGAPGYLGLSRVTMLTMSESFRSSAPWTRLLERAAHLRELEFSAQIRVVGMVQSAVLSASPLRHLHPTSLTTLSYLKVNTTILFPDGYMLFPNPYARICDAAALANLGAALERLDIAIILRGQVHLHRVDLFIPERWCQLSDLIGMHELLPKLRQVTLHIEAFDISNRVRARESPEQIVERRRQEIKRTGKYTSELAKELPKRMQSLRPDLSFSVAIELCSY